MGLTDQREGPISAGCDVPYGLRLAAVGEPSSRELPRVGDGDTDESGSPRCKSGASRKTHRPRWPRSVPGSQAPPPELSTLGCPFPKTRGYSWCRVGTR